MDNFYEECWKPEGHAKKKIILVRKILVQLQDLLQIVETKSTKYEENRRLIEQLEKVLEELKRDLHEKEERLSDSIEKIWAGIEETAVCLKGLEDISNGKNKENSEKDVYLPCYTNLDSIMKEHYRRRARRWSRLKKKLEDLARKDEERIPYEIGRQWEVISCNFESEDESKRTGDSALSEIPEKRAKLQDSENKIQGKENVGRSREEVEDDENFAKFLEKQAKRLEKKKKCKMVLKKKIVGSAAKTLNESEASDNHAVSQTSAPPPVLQELSLNRERPAETTRPPPETMALVPVTTPTTSNNTEPSREAIVLPNVKPYSGPVLHTFEEMNVSESLITGINLWGLSVPYALEKVAIPAFLAGLDVVVEAPPCTGKTTAACVSALNKLNTALKKPQAIFLYPTDDMAELVMRYMSDLGTLMDVHLSCNVSVAVALQSSQVFFGTPSNILSLISNRRLCTDLVKMLIVDTAEELAPESQQTIVQILYNLPGNTQFAVLTRQLTATISSLSQKMRSPVHVSCSNEHILSIVPTGTLPSCDDSPEIIIEEIENENPRPPGIDFDNMNQFYVVVETDELKIRVLAALADTMETEQAIIFCNSGQKADWLARKIRENERGLEVCSVHAGRENWDHLMTLFEAGISRVLITTDFITRSNFKVKPVSLVLNYEFPEVAENYTKRIMCAGRVGKGLNGGTPENPILVFSFISSENLPQLESLSKRYNFKIAPMSSQPA